MMHGHALAYALFGLGIAVVLGLVFVGGLLRLASRNRLDVEELDRRAGGGPSCP